jgi:hypothetical protein
MIPVIAADMIMMDLSVSFPATHHWKAREDVCVAAQRVVPGGIPQQPKLNLMRTVYSGKRQRRGGDRDP